MMTDKQIDILSTRCTFCEKLSESEFIPMFCTLCTREEPQAEPQEKSLPHHSYIEVPFYSPLPAQLKEQFVLMLWLIYEMKDGTVAPWQGVFSVNKTHGGVTLAEKFTNYARAVVPQFERIKDLICAKAPLASFKTLP